MPTPARHLVERVPKKEIARRLKRPGPPASSTVAPSAWPLVECGPPPGGPPRLPARQASQASRLAVDLRVRMLVMHQAEGFSERGMALSLSYNPTPSTPLGFTARVAPSWGGEATSGAEAMWGRETMAGMANAGLASGNRLDGEVGYGLPVGNRYVGTPRVGFSTSEYGRDYRIGYGMQVLEQGKLNLELGIDAERRESPLFQMQEQGAGTDQRVLGRASVQW